MAALRMRKTTQVNICWNKLKGDNQIKIIMFFNDEKTNTIVVVLFCRRILQSIYFINRNNTV